MKQLEIIPESPQHRLMGLWLQVEDGSEADDILFHAHMYVQMGEPMYRRWKEHYQFPNTIQAIFEKEDTPDDAPTNR